MSSPFRVAVVTLFPEFFGVSSGETSPGGPLGVGLVGRAFRESRAELQCLQPRDFARDRHRTVDGPPYGGGPGMVMKVEPLAEALEAARALHAGPAVLLSPRGRPLAQADLARWSEGAGLTLVCGRYEGFDERVRGLVDDEVSLGDFVLTGGEPAAAAVIDGVVRLLPETLGNPASVSADSFSDGLLEHPHFTRPERWEGIEVPGVLRGGDHGAVAAWRRDRQLETTARIRPDLLGRQRLSLEDRRGLLLPPRRLAIVVSSRAELPRLAAAAAAWRFELHVVGEGERLPRLETLEIPAWPRGRRRLPPVQVDLEAWVHRHRDAEEVRAYGSSEGLAEFAVEARVPGETSTVSPDAVRAAARSGGAVVWLDAPVSGLATLPAPRQAIEAAELDETTRAIVVADRILGEV